MEQERSRVLRRCRCNPYNLTLASRIFIESKTNLIAITESVKAEPQSLQRLVWLGLQWDIRQDGILPDLGQFLQPIYSRLLFSTQHLGNTSVDNIRMLDIEVMYF